MTTPKAVPVSPLRLRASRLSDTGLVLKNNGDFAGYIEPVKPAMLAQSGCLYVVADGLGGTKQGERTSQYAVERVLTEYYQNPGMAPGIRLRHVINRISLEIADLASESSFSAMQSTLVAAVIMDNMLTIASVGNCRAYLIHDGSVQQITRDQNEVVDARKQGSTSMEEMLAAAQVKAFTRSLGSYNTLVIDLVENIRMHAGDVLLLCSDGLTRYMADWLISSVVRDRTPEMICRSLVDYANAAGGEDNITVLAVIVEEEKVEILAHPTPPESAPHSTATGDNETQVEVVEGLPAFEMQVSPPTSAIDVQIESPLRFAISKEVYIVAALVGAMVFVCLVLGLLLLMW